MEVGINISPLNLDNGIDLNSQVEVYEVLNNHFFDVDYSSFTELHKRLIANQIAALALTCVHLGGYISDLYISSRIDDEFIVNLLIDTLGDVVTNLDSSDSDSNNSGSNPGGGTDTGINSDSSNNIPSSTNNSNFSILERIIV